MRSVLKFLTQHRAAAILLVDLAVLALFWLIIPRLSRPFEVLMALVAALGYVSVAIVGNRFLKNALLAVASLGLALFALEMAQKLFNVMNLAVTTETKAMRADGDPYAWDNRDPASYHAAVVRAIRDSVAPEAVAEHPRRDVFPGVPEERRSRLTDNVKNGYQVYEFINGSLLTRDEPPLGEELIPGTGVRHCVVMRDGEKLIHDGFMTVDDHGMRNTRDSGDNDADTYVFMGCSFTFGTFLNDDQTSPHYFSEALGFAGRVVNLAVPGYGPHQALFDFEEDRHLGPAGIKADRVRRVYYGLINDHPHRAVRPNHPLSPHYVLEDGELVYKGTYKFYTEGRGRLYRMLNRSRIYPILRERLVYRLDSGELDYKWRLAVAMLSRIDSLCRERFGVGLTILYWDEDRRVVAMLEEAGLEVQKVSDAFEGGWLDKKIRYYLYDHHPSAYANRRLGRYLAQQVMGGEID